MSKRPPAPAAPAAPPPPDAVKKSPRATIATSVPLSISSGTLKRPQRIAIYGTGGIGKSTLAAYLPAPFFLDVEGGTSEISCARDQDIPDLPALRGKLATLLNEPPQGVQSVVIDTATVIEEMAKEYVVASRETEGGFKVDSIEGFGWGKGWQFVYDEFNGILGDLDRLVEKRGFNVCVLIHECTTPVPNPNGEDFIRWEPHLYGGDKRQRGSIRNRVKQWADHLFFIGYDLSTKGGKAQGHGTRTIYTTEMPTHVACTRKGVPASIPFTLQDPAAIWREIGLLNVPAPPK